MGWNHLPVAGGIYAQSPEFIDGITLIFDAKARKEQAKNNRTEFEKSQRLNNVSKPPGM